MGSTQYWKPFYTWIYQKNISVTSIIFESFSYGLDKNGFMDDDLEKNDYLWFKCLFERL